ncbi:hypothetical protein SCHPADRAFT_213370 [Schizopora paradoxa]|uniref:Uncharacterized protein n=1 Tax=Schizopora paradoxa TaxID=27342 RepID=A0A0H2SH94_9AGAM|nr:hypothetical protein SCHPADRAFT_213370 [Schizopora paradoxa]
MIRMSAGTFIHAYSASAILRVRFRSGFLFHPSSFFILTIVVHSDMFDFFVLRSDFMVYSTCKIYSNIKFLCWTSNFVRTDEQSRFHIYSPFECICSVSGTKNALNFAIANTRRLQLHFHSK